MKKGKNQRMYRDKLEGYEVERQMTIDEWIGGVKMNKYRGDVWFADLKEEAGSLQTGRRPVIVVSNNLGNKHSSMITVVPCSTKIKNMKMTTHKVIKQFEKKETVALCEQIMTVPQEWLEKPLFILNEEEMKKVNEGIMIALGLKEVADASF